MGQDNTISVETLWAVSLASYLMAQVDGELHEDEYELLGSSLAELAGETVSSEQLDELLEKHAELVESAGFDGAAEALAKRLLTKEARQGALLLAAGVAYSDGEIEDDEEEAFSALAGHLGFSDEEGKALLTEALAEGEADEEDGEEEEDEEEDGEEEDEEEEEEEEAKK